VTVLELRRLLVSLHVLSEIFQTFCRVCFILKKQYIRHLSEFELKALKHCSQLARYRIKTKLNMEAELIFAPHSCCASPVSPLIAADSDDVDCDINDDECVVDELEHFLSTATGEHQSWCCQSPAAASDTDACVWPDTDLNEWCCSEEADHVVATLAAVTNSGLNGPPAHCISDLVNQDPTTDMDTTGALDSMASLFAFNSNSCASPTCK